jgi:hypothetical protein
MSVLVITCMWAGMNLAYKGKDYCVFKYCTMLRHLITSDHQMYRVTPLKTPFGLLIPLLPSQSHVTTITHNYFLRFATFTRLTIIHVRDYNHLLHSYTG